MMVPKQNTYPATDSTGSRGEDSPQTTTLWLLCVR